MSKEGSEADSIVRCSGFFTEGNDLVLFVGIKFDQFPHETVTDHAIADDDDRLFSFVHSGLILSVRQLALWR